MKMVLSFLSFLFSLSALAVDFRGSQLIAFTSPSNFTAEQNGRVLLTPKVTPQISWNELIASWNFSPLLKNGVTIDAKLFFDGRESAWYTLGKWSDAPPKFPRESVKAQQDDDAKVDTDTLQLFHPATAVQIRISWQNTPSLDESLKLLTLSFCDTKRAPEPLPPNKLAWGKTLVVKERSQASYPEGISSWCSPTSTSMLLSFWSTNLHRSELNYDVPEVARAVMDPNWPGTGNWPFNTAFAGSHRGMRAFVTRLSDISEIEDWIVAGYPLALSVSYNLLKGKPEKGNGHLVVCIGFSENGDIVVNDPGRSLVRQAYSRANLEKAWAESHQTVYLLFPEGASLPPDRFGHWGLSQNH